MAISGVYKITNTANGKFYIGSSVNISARWNRHRRMLDTGSHDNLHLQAAWNKYGADNFAFEVLEECRKSDTLILEQKYLDEYDAGKSDNCYNVSGYAMAAHKGRPLSEETKRKMSKARKGKPHGPMSEAQRKQMSEARIGGKLDGRTKLKMRESSPYKKAVLQLNLDGEIIAEYPSIKQASRTTGVNSSGISLCCSGKMETAKGYRWRMKERASKMPDRVISEEHRQKIRKAKSRPVIQLSKANIQISEYASILEASKATKTERSNICGCCNERRKSAGGYMWRYAR